MYHILAGLLKMGDEHREFIKGIGTLIAPNSRGLKTKNMGGYNMEWDR